MLHYYNFASVIIMREHYTIKIRLFAAPPKLVEYCI